MRRTTLATLLVSCLFAALTLFAFGCAAPTGTGAATLDKTQALEQAPGVLASVADILAKSPVATTPEGQAALGWAKTAASFAADMKTGLASPDQFAGAYVALRNTLATLPDSSVQAAVSPYLGWSDTIAQVLDLFVSVAKGSQVPSANPTPAQ